MFEIFTKAKQKIVNSVKSDEQLIKEIHDDFYTEVDRLLAEANIQQTIDKDENLIERAKRLERLGFSNVKIVTKANAQIKSASTIEINNIERNRLIEAITYFTQKYPQYKFITRASVIKLCQKYNLVLGSVEQYTGNVPEKNLLEIENFKIDKNDTCYIRGSRDWSSDVENYDAAMMYNKTYSSSRKYIKEPFNIVAPEKDFNIKEDQKVSNFQIVPKDPIVLQSVIYNNRSYFLIVTAWGIEADDDLVKIS